MGYWQKIRMPQQGLLAEYREHCRILRKKKSFSFTHTELARRDRSELKGFEPAADLGKKGSKEEVVVAGAAGLKSTPR